MTQNQQNEIRNYLMTKKLPIDILLEVHDHFIAQILDLQQQKNIDFSVALDLTKISWNEELSTYFPWYVMVKNDTVKRTRFEQKIRRRANLDLFKKSLCISLFIFIVFYSQNIFIEHDNFWRIFQIEMFAVIGLAYVAIFYNFIFNSFAFKKENRNYKFSIYQWHVFAISSFGYFGLYYLRPLRNVVTNFNNYNFTFELVSKILVLFLLIFLFIYTGIAQIKLAKTLRKIKPQLQFI